MKFTSMLAVVVFLGSVAASPLLSPDNTGLESWTKPKCQWKDKQCCAPDKDDHKSDDYGYDRRYGHRYTIYVKSHRNIQSALNKASSGDRIVVEAGIYAEQLTIEKDNIELIGKGAVLVPPKKAVKNKCSGLSGPKTEAGICVIGKGVKMARFIVDHRKVLSVERPVKDVSITGFEVHQFSGINIAIIGARNARVTKNTLTDGAKYGVLTAGSYKTLVSENKVSFKASATAVGFIAICLDNLSDVLVKKNEVSNYEYGICVQTNGADVQYNKVTRCCFAIFVDPFVIGAKIRHNYAGPSNPACRGASGITIDGAVRTKVSYNLIEGQKSRGKAAGLAVIDDECPQSGPGIVLSCLTHKRKAISSDNTFIWNTIRNNDLDVFANTTGKGNEFNCNSCKTSSPEGLCMIELARSEP